MATEYTITDGGGLIRLEGYLNPDPAENPATAYVTSGSAPPGASFVTPLVFDDTASTGGLYAWDGTQYIQVGLATS